MGTQSSSERQSPENAMGGYAQAPFQPDMEVRGGGFEDAAFRSSNIGTRGEKAFGAGAGFAEAAARSRNIGSRGGGGGFEKDFGAGAGFAKAALRRFRDVTQSQCHKMAKTNVFMGVIVLPSNQILLKQLVPPLSAYSSICGYYLRALVGEAEYQEMRSQVFEESKRDKQFRIFEDRNDGALFLVVDARDSHLNVVELERRARYLDFTPIEPALEKDLRRALNE